MYVVCFVAGPVFGNRDYFTGLAVFFDTYSNHNGEHAVSPVPLLPLPALSTLDPLIPLSPTPLPSIPSLALSSFSFPPWHVIVHFAF